MAQTVTIQTERGEHDPGAPAQPERPLVSFGREICGDLAAALRREWLVTNGLGGYASGTLAGIATRRYHGLLVAALTPPVGRTVLVGGMAETACCDGHTYPLSAHEFDGGVINTHGYRYLQSFTLEWMLPVWVFALGDALLERRIWMAHRQNTTYIAYRLLRGTRSMDLNLTPLVTFRDFHALTSGQGWQPTVEPRPRGAVIRAFDGAQPFRLLADGGSFSPGGVWWWNFHHREETARGLDDRSDLFAPGSFAAKLHPGETFTLALTTEESVERNRVHAPAVAEGRQIALVRAAPHARDAFARQLVLAADQFVVKRNATEAEAKAGAQDGKTVIAGYHWFNDWGRDTMIALPGLTLATGRPEDAAGILRTFARYVSDGLCPNNFPDSSGALPGYNTADATLWYFVAVYAYHRETGDEALVDELLPILREIVARHVQGTRFGIGMDAADGLLRAGESGVQLSWMDAKVGDWVVTPRTGKPVEINALWYNALRILARFCADREDTVSAEEFDALADRARASFRARFVVPDRRHLADVIDGPHGDDLSIRPNQIFAVSLPFPLLDGQDAAGVVDAVGRDLLTSAGLRSLAPDDPAYQGDYGGDQRQRDGAYHQGPVWTWLLGPYAEAHFNVYRNVQAALDLLRPLEHHLSDAGLGTISEILEGDAPHLPRGCIAQAWGVAETLRVWLKLQAAKKR